MNRGSRRAAFPCPTAFWKTIQLPGGALVELPTVVSHTLSRLRNRNSGWWVAAYTEYAARAAAFVLSEVYDSLMLWRLPSALVALIRSLDLSFVLGNQANVDELEGLLQVVMNTDFRYHAPAQRLRLAHGRKQDELIADFVYYDPWQGKVLDHDEYVAMRTRGRAQMPSGHPQGYRWNVDYPGWDGRRYVASAGAEAPAEEVPKVEYFGLEHIKNHPSRLYDRRASESTQTQNYQGAFFGVF